MSKKAEDTNDNESAAKYFDETNYSTLIIGAEKNEETKQQGDGIVELLIEGIKENKAEALRILKEQNGQHALINAIENITHKSERALLLAACWESGLDFSSHFDSFLSYLGADALVSLEAITVLENIETFSSTSSLEKGVQLINELIKKGHVNTVLLDDLKLHFQHIIDDMKGSLN
jgi:hypothetical protein